MRTQRSKRSRWFKIVWGTASCSSEVEVVLSVMGPLGILTLYTEPITVCLGAFRQKFGVYLPSGPPTDGCHQHCREGTGTHCFHGWLWGRATEEYDMCLEYFGLGPLLFLCWLP